MANDKLQRILEMSKNMEKKGSKDRTPHRKPVSLQSKVSNANAAIANIDAAYNAPYVPTKEETEAWNTERGREELTEMADNDVFLKKLGQSKLPSAILESMRQNPCNYDASIVNNLMGPENALFKRLNEVYNKKDEEPMSGVKAVQQINEQLDKRDKQLVTETKSDVESNNSLGQNNQYDLSTLEQVIERVIDRKLNMLNESVSRQGNSPIKMMSLTSDGNFRFLDSEDNVYECQMKYLGKRKKKQ